MDIFSSLVRPVVRVGCVPELFRGASLIVDSCLWYRVGVRLALFETPEVGCRHVGLCSEYFRADVMVLGSKDASGNDFEVFVCYEIGSVFAF